MTTGLKILQPIHARRRGSIYIAVLGTCLIVTTLAVGGLLATRAQSRAIDSGSDTVEAQLCAQSAMELARLWIKQDASWRSNRPNGDWTTALALGGGIVSINVVDSIDGDLTNRPYDPVVVTVTAQKAAARHVLQQTLAASPTPLPALKYALHTGGELHVRSNRRFIVGSATASTNGNLRNDNAIEGNVDALSASASGIIFGTLTTGVASRSMPDSGVAEAYARLGTLIAVPTTIDKQVLSPGRNPWGTPNADGVYVIRSTGNITIRNTRINGTLVVIAPGKNVTLDNVLFFQPARSDYPALIIVGDAVLQYTSSSSLSESSAATNFNPTGAPYAGVTDNDTADTYPSEIQGLVHVTGTVTISQPGIIRGAMIAESTAASNAVDVNISPFQIIYNSALWTSPPQFYTTSVQMVPLAGSLKQVVN